LKKFNDYIFEQDQKGWGLTAIDVDETVFRTFAEIYVMKDGKITEKLNNMEFNAYKLKEGETFDFREFRSAKKFNDTSIPIPQTVKRIKKMLKRIKETGSKSKIIFLTARADFDDKKTFLKTFEDNGIDMDKSNVYVERSGNLKTGSTEARKKKILLDYLKTGLYRRVRLLDDFKPNLKALLEIRDNLPQDIEDKVRKTYKLSDNETAIKFWALHVKENGDLEEMK